MSDDLRRVYEGQGALDRYYDGATPPYKLYRGRRMGDSTDLMQPTLIGWYAKRGPRHPDVLLEEAASGNRPQYTEKDKLVEEDRAKPLTQDLVANAAKYTVKGCRTMQGEHRGVSVFDRSNAGLRNFDWFEIPAGTELDPALAVTRDSPRAAGSGADPIHHTIAPKDDMPLSLFLQHLKGLAAKAKLV